MSKQEHPEEALIEWDKLRAAVAEQPEVEPSPDLRRRVLAQIRVREADDLAPPPSWWTWAWGVAVALLTMAILWFALKPGIVLEWTAQTTEISATFVLSRAPAGTRDFQRLHTFASREANQRYRYVDVAVWPGRTYVYRVAAYNGGRMLDQRTLTVAGHVALPGQIAVLVTGVLAGYGSVLLVKVPLWQTKHPNDRDLNQI
jgi:hypothetical protein